MNPSDNLLMAAIDIGLSAIRMNIAGLRPDGAIHIRTRTVELMLPVLQEDFKGRVIRILKAEMSDNQKARLLRPDGGCERVSAGRSEPFRAQERLDLQGVEEQERLRTLTPVRFAPIEWRG